MSSDDESDYETYTDTDIDSNATAELQDAYYTLVERFLGRVASFMMKDDIWVQIPDMIATYSWIEHNPLLRTGANYDNINRFKELAADKEATVTQRRFAISILSPGDIFSLLPVLLETTERFERMYNGFEGLLTRAQVRAFYYFVTMPEPIKKIFLTMPDMYRMCHAIVEEAIENKTAVSLLKARSVPYYMQPTIPMTTRGKPKRYMGQPIHHLTWTKKRADSLNIWAESNHGRQTELT